MCSLLLKDVSFFFLHLGFWSGNFSLIVLFLIIAYFKLLTEEGSLLSFFHWKCSSAPFHFLFSSYLLSIFLSNADSLAAISDFISSTLKALKIK